VRYYLVSALDATLKNYLQSIGWERTKHLWDCDVVVFGGGADLKPKMYGEVAVHPMTVMNAEHDGRDVSAYKAAKRFSKPCVGICRGAQFLHVMNGGKLYQHSSGHQSPHEVVNTHSGEISHVSSTHHQVMKGTVETERKGDIILKSVGVENSLEGFSPSGTPFTQIQTGDTIECVVYKESKDFCFQPHPEFSSGRDTPSLFVSLVNNFLCVEV
jgi:gamma-glutamyl-gamma-aminobutyrate hydrolase PuuD